MADIAILLSVVLKVICCAPKRTPLEQIAHAAPKPNLPIDYVQRNCVHTTLRHSVCFRLGTSCFFLIPGVECAIQSKCNRRGRRPNRRLARNFANMMFLCRWNRRLTKFDLDLITLCRHYICGFVSCTRTLLTQTVVGSCGWGKCLSPSAFATLAVWVACPLCDVKLHRCP